MKGLAIGSVLILTVCFLSAPAFPFSYQIDVWQDGRIDTGGTVHLYGQIGAVIDIKICGYTCPPNDKLFGVQTYISVDESLADITACVPDAVGCDPTLSGCTEQSTGVYLLVCSNFSLMDTVGGAKTLGQVTVDCVSNGVTDMVVADDQTAYGFSYYNDGFASDCNLQSFHPTDGILTIEQLP